MLERENLQSEWRNRWTALERIRRAPRELSFFFLNDPAPPEFSTLPHHPALPIWRQDGRPKAKDPPLGVRDPAGRPHLVEHRRGHRRAIVVLAVDGVAGRDDDVGLLVGLGEIGRAHV